MDQWDLTKENYNGHWQGRVAWYLEGEGQGINWERPGRVEENSKIYVDFPTANHGIWQTKRVPFTKSDRLFCSLMRDDFNPRGESWVCRQMGGQSPLRLDASHPVVAVEVNFFFGHSRVLVVLMWGRTEEVWTLRMVGTMALKRGGSPRLELARTMPNSADELIGVMDGWTGIREKIKPTPGPGAANSVLRLEEFDPKAFKVSDCNQLLANGVILSVPNELTGDEQTIRVGCCIKLGERYMQADMKYSEGRLASREACLYVLPLGELERSADQPAIEYPEGFC